MPNALAYNGALTLDIASALASSETFDLFNFGSESGALTSVTLSGAYSGSLIFDTSDTWAYSSGSESWAFTQSTGELAFTLIPESSVALLGALGILLLLHRRR
jgi:hypothetical protein